MAKEGRQFASPRLRGEGSAFGRTSGAKRSGGEGASPEEAPSSPPPPHPRLLRRLAAFGGPLPASGERRSRAFSPLPFHFFRQSPRSTMKFTLSWLKDHLDTTASLDEIAETLTRIGLEVEGIEDRAKALSAYTIASVISAEPHPNADRLRVCLVDTGAGTPVQVVCGAPNARTGMKSVFSPPGTFIPGKNITLSVGTIRGVESHGMLCSAAELELSNDHDGIIDLPEDAPVGARYADWAGLGDPVIEINLTPNRGDCTSIHGIARDLAAADVGV